MPTRRGPDARHRAAHRTLAALLAVGYVAALTFLTLRPERADAGIDASLLALLARLRAAGYTWAEYGTVEWLANVALFVPAGLFLAIVLPRSVRWWGVAIGVVASGAIETVQALFLPDRVATIADVAANTLGSAIGVTAIVGARVWVVAVGRLHRSPAGVADHRVGGAPRH